MARACSYAISANSRGSVSVTETLTLEAPVVANAMPEPVLAWPEFTEALGFAGREAVDFAASWFPALSERMRRRIDPNPIPTRVPDGFRYARIADGADGPVWVDKGTGEIMPKPDTLRADLDAGAWADTFGD